MLNIPNSFLQKMYQDGKFTAPNGEVVELTNSGGVSWELAETLYKTVKHHRFTRCLEIGMASGISTLSILTALAETGDAGMLVSMDPFQSTHGRNAGRHHVEQAGFGPRHRLLEAFDYLALPKLLADGDCFDFIYIDGNHEFDYVILDFFYADLLLNVGGVVAFNDCGWRPVHAAMRHVPPADRYTEIDVGLKPNYTGRNIAATLQRRLTNRNSADRYFKKRA